jgi:hypothetical protein
MQRTRKLLPMTRRAIKQQQVMLALRRANINVAKKQSQLMMRRREN